MKSFPMFLRMNGRRVVICGGGEEAARKCRLVLKTEAEIIVVGPAEDPELESLIASGRVLHEAAADAHTFDGAALTFIATGCPAYDAALACLARGAGAVVNVVDRPEMCDAFTPSIVDRDPVVVAIGTEGAAPVLGRRIKTDIETMLPPRLGPFVGLVGRLRGAVAQRVAPARRRAFWEWVFDGAPFQAHLDGRERDAARLIKDAVNAGTSPEAKGHIALVGAGPGARDLLTLRAVQRLQQADIIFYDRLVDPEVLELARRDADRVYVGKEVGACAWPQDHIDRLIVAEAAKGRRVVRLKSGDPSVFGRAAEELAAAEAAGIDVEIVPGITAASAAAARLKTPLTERGEIDTFALTTGTSRPGDADPCRARLAHPGTAVAFYMAVDKAEVVRRDMMAAGAPGACPVDIVACVSSPEERHVSCTLDTLPDKIHAEGVRSPAILFVRYPKSMAAASRPAALLAAE
ncbi:siroheme synthase CysG [Sagittula stellata]|uniref:Uroporphyrin-III C-methyltransferase n=1 Tax=Sagittula stellata (strain ATCC 700073 / DSM 11524 / E-37) TaxID=388399 RepID=A3K8F9_SAGS3|nr:siroheme synthase CysG [Sagittula stellata]EBA06638.1 uroporphyrin-III C-methyltransferase [Sagittula stellata E-37]